MPASSSEKLKRVSLFDVVSQMYLCIEVFINQFANQFLFLCYTITLQLLILSSALSTFVQFIAQIYELCFSEKII